jgi:hypothetical protein
LRKGSNKKKRARTSNSRSNLPSFATVHPEHAPSTILPIDTIFAI